MNKIITNSLLAAFLLTACTQQEEGTPPNHWEDAVCFTSYIGKATTVRATATQFEENDSISIFAFTNAAGFATATESYAANKMYVYRTDRFVPLNKENAISYPTNAGSLAFHAIYPYCASATGTFSFSVKEDQQGELNYTRSDLMTASTVSTTEQTPSLRFAHRLANVEINLSFAEVPAGTVNVSFQNVTTATSVDMTTGSFKGTGEQNKSVKTATNGTNGYKVILPPQSIQTGTALVVISTDTGESYTWEMPKTTEWKSGLRYAYTLTINKQGEVTFTSSINPWEEDEEIEQPGGKLVVQALDGSRSATFIHQPKEFESFVVDTCFSYEDYGKDGPYIELYIGKYSAEQHLYTGIDCWISNYDVTYPNFFSDESNRSVSARLDRVGMNMRVSLSGKGNLEISSQETIPVDIISGEYLLPLSFVGTMKKNIQDISELNFPNLGFELPFPVDEAMIITQGGKYTRGGELNYREGSIARYDEMKQKIEASGFTLQEEEIEPDNKWKEGTWVKENVQIYMTFDLIGMGTIISDGTDYHLSIAVVEVSSPIARSASSSVPNMNRMKKLRPR